MKRVLAFLVLTSGLFAGDAKVVLLAGRPSHPPGAHEYNAGMLLIQKWLRQNPGVNAVVVKGGWPEDPTVFDGAAAIVMYMDGGKWHPALNHLEVLERLTSKGVGLGAIHYGLEVPPDTGGPQFLEWLGGYYETGYSRNPINDTLLEQASPEHPVSAGWKTYELKDEWYYHIRFRPNDSRLTPILTTMLPKDAPQKETVAWVVERPDGGRGFGFTGGHFQSNWGTLESRRLVTNAILWIAKVPIPSGGARCDVTPDELTRNLDDKPAPAPRKK